VTFSHFRPEAEVVVHSLREGEAASCSEAPRVRPNRRLRGAARPCPNGRRRPRPPPAPSQPSFPRSKPPLGIRFPGCSISPPASSIFSFGFLTAVLVKRTVTRAPGASDGSIRTSSSSAMENAGGRDRYPEVQLGALLVIAMEPVAVEAGIVDAAAEDAEDLKEDRLVDEVLRERIRQNDVDVEVLGLLCGPERAGQKETQHGGGRQGFHEASSSCVVSASGSPDYHRDLSP